MLVLSILLGISFLFNFFCLYAVWRLNKYIAYKIETRIEEVEDRQDLVEQTVKMALGENLINSNGRIKRPYV